MQCKALPTDVRTPRLILREWRITDQHEAHTYACLEKTCRFMPWGPNTAAQTKAFLRFAIASNRREPRSSFEFAVVLQTSNLVIGGCGLRIKDPDHTVGDMGYCLHPDHWGKGYGTELAGALLYLGFRGLRLHRIWATCDVRNRRSEKVLLKIGMKKEGILREHLFIKGRWRSSCLFACLSTAPRSPKTTSGKEVLKSSL